SGSGTGGSSLTAPCGCEGWPASPRVERRSPIRPAASSSRIPPRCGSPSAAQASTTWPSSRYPARAPSPASKLTNLMPRTLPHRNSPPRLRLTDAGRRKTQPRRRGSGLGGLRRRLELGADQGLALDVALADQPEGEDRAGETEQGAEQEDHVEAVDEPLF